MKKIDTSIAEYYQKQTLDTDKMVALLNESQKVKRKHWYRNPVPLSAVASLLGVLIIGSLFYQGTLTDPDGHIILQEASLNHKSKLQLDFQSAELSVLDTAMSKLDFPLLLPESLGQQFNILGARYCTLNGNLAAHIKLARQDSENTISLFMTQNQKNLAGLIDQSEVIDGTNVSSWAANGMFYVLAAN